MAGADLVLPFALFAGTIFAGVVAHRVFQRTRIPDVVLIMGLGAALGPVGLGLLDVGALGAAAPFIGAFALLIILLEGGLELNYHHVVEKARATTTLTVMSLALTTLAVAGVAAFAGLGFWPLGVLLGIAVAPLSASVLVPMLGGLRVQPPTRAILSMECTLGEALAVIVLVAATAGAVGNLDLPQLTAQVGLTFVIGVGLAVVGGLLWLELLRFLGRTPYSYMVTLAAAVGLFAVIEFLGGNGYVGVLVLGLVLSNAREISDHLPRPLRTTVALGDTLRWMNTEVTFIVRTFFFVYLGALLSPAAFTLERILLGLGLLTAVIVARLLAVAFLVRVRPAEREDAEALLVLVPRGLATAVLAALPLGAGLAGGQALVEVASVVIVLSNLAMTAGLMALHRTGPDPAAAPPGEPHGGPRPVDGPPMEKGKA